MKTIYRNYVIHSNSNINDKGIFDVRVVLQKKGTTHITTHYPSCSSLIKNDSEVQGNSVGRELVDMLLQRKLSTLYVEGY
jgi:hypothetical protein